LYKTVLKIKATQNSKPQKKKLPAVGTGLHTRHFRSSPPTLVEKHLWASYSLTPSSRMLFETLLVPKVVNKYPAFYGT
jgi:hypothetical protein